MASAAHLAKRFAVSLLPFGPRRADAAWAEGLLGGGELGLWRRMSRQDRRHAVGVARRVAAALDDPEEAVLAAALLHDVGKLDSRLGTFGRVIATLSAAVAGRDMAAVWTRRRGFTRRVGLYLQHAQLGGDLLAVAGAAPLVQAWAREHHGPEASWTVPVDVGRALKAADDD